MKHYILHIHKQNVKFKVSYKNGRFFRLERIYGFLEGKAFMYIGKIIPTKESELQHFIDTFEGKVSYTQQTPKPKTLYQEFVSSWHTFYNSQYGIDPRFNAVEGNNLKQLIAYLKKISESPEEALTIWQQLLSNWEKLDDFHKRNPDLKYINSNINRIIENVKKPTNQKTRYSDDFKRKISERLQS